MSRSVALVLKLLQNVSWHCIICAIKPKQLLVKEKCHRCLFHITGDDRVQRENENVTIQSLLFWKLNLSVDLFAVYFLFSTPGHMIFSREFFFFRFLYFCALTHEHVVMILCQSNYFSKQCHMVWIGKTKDVITSDSKIMVLLSYYSIAWPVVLLVFW